MTGAAPVFFMQFSPLRGCPAWPCPRVDTRCPSPRKRGLSPARPPRQPLAPRPPRACSSTRPALCVCQLAVLGLNRPLILGRGSSWPSPNVIDRFLFVGVTSHSSPPLGQDATPHTLFHPSTDPSYSHRGPTSSLVGTPHPTAPLLSFSLPLHFHFQFLLRTFSPLFEAHPPLCPDNIIISHLTPLSFLTTSSPPTRPSWSLGRTRGFN